MLQKAFDLGVLLCQYNSINCAPELVAHRDRVQSEMAGLSSSLGLSLSLDLLAGKDFGSTVVDLSHRLRGQFDEATSSAFRLGFLLPSLGPSPVASSMSGPIGLALDAVQLPSKLLQDYLDSTPEQRCELIAVVSGLLRAKDGLSEKQIHQIFAGNLSMGDMNINYGKAGIVGSGKARDITQNDWHLHQDSIDLSASLRSWRR